MVKFKATKYLFFFSCNPIYFFGTNKKILYFCDLMIQLFLITFVLLALAFAGIAIKILIKKDGKFAGTCASKLSIFLK